MQIFNSLIFNNKIQSLARYSSLQGVDDPVIFASKLSSLNSSKLQNLFSQSSNKEDVLNRILNYLGVDSDNKTLLKALTNQFKPIIDSYDKQLKSEENEENDKDNDVKNPINEDELNWYMKDTNDLFSENITQEDFLDKFNKLNEDNSDSAYYAEYLKAINDMGADNFFSALDSDKDGILNASEIGTLVNSDGDNLSISADEFNNIYGEYLDKNPFLEKDLLNNKNIPLSEEKSKNEAISDTSASIPNQNTDNVSDSSSSSPSSSSSSSLSPSSSSSSGSSSSGSSSDSTSGTVQNSDTATPQNEQPKETVEDLVKQKNEIKQTTEAKVNELNGQIDELLSKSNAGEDLKKNYDDAKKDYDENKTEIDKNELKLQEFDKNILDIDKSISALNGEKSTIKTDSGFSETDTKNKYRISAIETKIKELTDEKEKIEKNKAELSTKNETLKENQATLTKNLEDAQKALMEGLDEDTNKQIESLKEQIQTLENDKNTKIAELDKKIETLKTQEIEDSKKSGEATGELESNPVGSKFVEDALKYNGMKGGSKFSTGDYGWCADFVTYVVKEVAQSIGMSEEQIKDLRNNHLGASPQKLVKKNKEHVTEVEGNSIEQLQKTIKPGMAFICKGGGASGQHTGFVAKVNDDGTFLSIEGNHGNKVCQVTRNIKDMYRFVDFSYLFT